MTCSITVSSRCRVKVLIRFGDDSVVDITAQKIDGLPHPRRDLELNSSVDSIMPPSRHSLP
jgi:hypothetical protein